MNKKVLFAILIVLVIVLAGTTLYFATKKNVNQPNKTTNEDAGWKNFSWNGNSLSFKYPSKICYDNADVSSCHEIKVMDVDGIKIIGQTQNGGINGGGYEGEYIEPILKIYYANGLSQNEAENYLRDNKFPEVKSWSVKKGEIGEVSIASFADNSKIHAAYSRELSTLVAFMNNADMACLIDCGVIENNIYHGIKLDGVEVYQK